MDCSVGVSWCFQLLGLWLMNLTDLTLGWEARPSPSVMIFGEQSCFSTENLTAHVVWKSHTPLALLRAKTVSHSFPVSFLWNIPHTVNNPPLNLQRSSSLWLLKLKKKKNQPINQPLSLPSLHNDPVCFSSGSPERVHRTSEKSLDEQHSVGSSASNPRKSSLSLLHFGQQIYWRDDTKLLIIKIWPFKRKFG